MPLRTKTVEVERNVPWDERLVSAWIALALCGTTSCGVAWWCLDRSVMVHGLSQAAWASGTISLLTLLAGVGVAWIPPRILRRTDVLAACGSLIINGLLIAAISHVALLPSSVPDPAEQVVRRAEKIDSTSLFPATPLEPTGAALPPRDEEVPVASGDPELADPSRALRETQQVVTAPAERVEAEAPATSVARSTPQLLDRQTAADSVPREFPAENLQSSQKARVDPTWGTYAARRVTPAPSNEQPDVATSAARIEWARPAAMPAKAVAAEAEPRFAADETSPAPAAVPPAAASIARADTAGEESVPQIAASGAAPQRAPSAPAVNVNTSATQSPSPASPAEPPSTPSLAASTGAARATERTELSRAERELLDPAALARATDALDATAVVEPALPARQESAEQIGATTDEPSSTARATLRPPSGSTPTRVARVDAPQVQAIAHEPTPASSQSAMADRPTSAAQEIASIDQQTSSAGDTQVASMTPSLDTTPRPLARATSEAEDESDAQRESVDAANATGDGALASRATLPRAARPSVSTTVAVPTGPSTTGERSVASTTTGSELQAAPASSSRLAQRNATADGSNNASDAQPNTAAGEGPMNDTTLADTPASRDVDGLSDLTGSVRDEQATGSARGSSRWGSRLPARRTEAETAPLVQGTQVSPSEGQAIGEPTSTGSAPITPGARAGRTATLTGMSRRAVGPRIDPGALSVSDGATPSASAGQESVQRGVERIGSATPSATAVRPQRRNETQDVPGGLLVDNLAPAGPGGIGRVTALDVGVAARRAVPESEQVVDGQARFIRREVGGQLAIRTNVPMPTEAFQNRLSRRGIPREGEATEVASRTEKVIEAGLVYLAKLQQEDGRWSFQRTGETFTDAAPAATMEADTAATGLALLAFLGAGYQHQTGQYASVIDRGLDYLLSHQRGDGDLYLPQESVTNRSAWLYSHAIASIALCEAFGMTQDPTLRQPAQKAIDFIVSAQHPRLGGWRYAPGVEADTSVSGWMVMALRSAELANLNVPLETWRGVERWLGFAQLAPQRADQFRYNPFAPATPAQVHGRRPSQTMTAVGLLMRLYFLGGRDQPDVQRGADYLAQHLPQLGDSQAPERDTYYWYYATQVMFHMRGSHWEQWNAQLHPLLTDSQQTTGVLAGSWDPRGEIPDKWAPHGGRLYVTTMNLLSLEVHYRHLPIYEDASR